MLLKININKKKKLLLYNIYTNINILPKNPANGGNPANDKKIKII
jgi:hypothetical protein